MSTFKELGVSAPILQAIEEIGFREPMPVQEKAIPFLLSPGSGDVVALAQTGTGKTAAFGIPIIQQTDVCSTDAQFLILSPTRELCMQIAADLADYSKYINGLHIIPMYGGTSIENQIRNFRRGAHIIVATPGRLIDLMERGVVKLDTIRTVILDEADEMLNMGFSEALETILQAVPKERKMLMFSATMSREISNISKKYLNNAQEIVIGSRNEGAQNVNHVYYMVHAKDKYLALKRIVDYYPDIYAIIFCRTKLETQEIADKLIQDGYNSDSLHGDLSQAQRDLAMNKFRRRQLQILVATDVAARGLDVDDLTHVINYGLPDDTENYTHRSGRTGRAGKTGTSISIINLREKSKIRIIEKAIGKQFQQGIMPTGQQICEKQLIKVIDDLEHTQVDEEQISQFLPEVFRKFDWLDKDDIVKRVVMREFGRFMQYYANAPELEEVSSGKSDKSDRAEERASRKRDRSHTPEEGFTRLFINVGKMDGIHTSQIIEQINQRLHGPRIDIGRIDLMKTFSFFEVQSDAAQDVVDALSGSYMKGRQINVEIAEASNNAKSKTEKSKEKQRPAKETTGERPYRKERSAEEERPRRKDRKEKSARSKKERRSPSRAPYVNSNSPRSERNGRKGRAVSDEDWRKFFE
ncbi:MAG: DEAD/DEAH box helicase [Bacteroidaceae bacterium]|nr:DEAD/DEAH box helicase [Bacteroidaceae bacterium]